MACEQQASDGQIAISGDETHSVITIKKIVIDLERKSACKKTVPRSELGLYDAFCTVAAAH